MVAKLARVSLVFGILIGTILIGLRHPSQSRTERLGNNSPLGQYDPDAAEINQAVFVAYEGGAGCSPSPTTGNDTINCSGSSTTLNGDSGNDSMTNDSGGTLLNDMNG